MNIETQIPDAYNQDFCDDNVLGPLFRQVKQIEKNVEEIEKQFEKIISVSKNPPPANIFAYHNADSLLCDEEDGISVLSVEEQVQNIVPNHNDYEPRPLSPTINKWCWRTDGKLVEPPTHPSFIEAQVDKNSNKRENIDALHESLSSMFDPIPLSFSFDDGTSTPHKTKSVLALVSRDPSVHEDDFDSTTILDKFPSSIVDPPLQDFFCNSEPNHSENTKSCARVDFENTKNEIDEYNQIGSSHFTASLQSLERSMQETKKSQFSLQEWDRRVCGLKRSHCTTMRNTSRSRKRVQTFVRNQMKEVRNTVMPGAA